MMDFLGGEVRQPGYGSVSPKLPYREVMLKLCISADVLSAVR